MKRVPAEGCCGRGRPANPGRERRRGRGSSCRLRGDRLVVMAGSPWGGRVYQMRSPARKAAASGLGGDSKKVRHRRVLDQPTAIEEEDAVGEPARLAQIVGGHDQRHALGLQRRQHLLDLGAWRPGRAARSARRGTAPRASAPRRGQSPAAAARRREHEAGRSVGKGREAEAGEGHRCDRAARASRPPPRPARGMQVGARRAAQHHRLLEHHGVALRRPAGAARKGPVDAATGGREQAVAEPQRQRLSRSRWGR
jgi:hypothetical protein